MVRKAEMRPLLPWVISSGAPSTVRVMKSPGLGSSEMWPTSSGQVLSSAISAAARLGQVKSVIGTSISSSSMSVELLRMCSTSRDVTSSSSAMPLGAVDMASS